MRLRLAAFVVAVSVLSGCAATVKKDASDATMQRLPQASSYKLVLNVGGPPASTGASDWQGFRNEWIENFQQQTSLAGIAFEMQEGPPRATGQAGTLLFVYVKDYRFLRPGTRYAVGVLAGNAYIESTLAYSDLKSGAPFGSQTANTSSSAWEGVFSAMTNKQVEAIAADVVKQMKAGQQGRGAN